MAKKVFIDDSILWNDDKAILCMLFSDRSDGKTTLLYCHAYDTFKETGKIGVIARRYCEEVTADWVKIGLANLQERRAGIGKLTYKGSSKKSGIHLYEDGKEFAVCVPLSRATAIKSALDCKTHKHLYIDEYIPLNGRYLYHEVDAIFEIYRTIDRDISTTDGKIHNKIIVASNHISATCPLFYEFDIVAREGLTRYRNGRAILFLYANKGNRESIRVSPLGELLAGTQYGEYAYNGASLNGVECLIDARHGRGRLPIVVRCEMAQIGFFACKTNSEALVIDYTTPNSGDTIYTTKPNGGTNGGIYLPIAKAAKRLRLLYKSSLILYASERVWEETKDLSKILST